jgi:hypothetical protein
MRNRIQGITNDTSCTCPCIFRKSAKLITPRGAARAVVMLLRYLRCLSGSMDTWRSCPPPPRLFVCLGGLRTASTGRHLFPVSFPRCCPYRPRAGALRGLGRSRGCHVGLPLQPIVALVFSKVGTGGRRFAEVMSMGVCHSGLGCGGGDCWQWCSCRWGFVILVLMVSTSMSLFFGWSV